MTVPAGIQSGDLLRLKGLGLPELNGHHRGDQLLRVLLWTPDELTPEQEEQFQRFDEWAVEYIAEHSERLFKKLLVVYIF